MHSLTLSAPAKVNLFLRILGKRCDGYHELASLFQTIGLADILSFSFSTEDAFSCTNPLISSDNLVTQAVDLFRRVTGLTFRISIHLVKNIPVQAGLGGGSSDAAATLKGLNELCGFPIPYEELKRVSLGLGSDVPFFFTSGAAYCTGRGEIMREVPRFGEKIKIYKPDVGLSTPAVYKALDIKQCSTHDPEYLLDGFLNGDPLYINDLEKPAFFLLPNLKTVKQRFGGTMSGSGTAFFRVSLSIPTIAAHSRS